MKWPEWLVLGLSFSVLVIVSFTAQGLAGILGIGGNLGDYLIFAKVLGVIFSILALACIINMIITAVRAHIEKKLRRTTARRKRKR